MRRPSLLGQPGHLEQQPCTHGGTLALVLSDKGAAVSLSCLPWSGQAGRTLSYRSSVKDGWTPRLGNQNTGSLFVRDRQLQPQKEEPVPNG